MALAVCSKLGFATKLQEFGSIPSCMKNLARGGCPILAVFARVGILWTIRARLRSPSNLNPHPLKCAKGGAPTLPSRLSELSSHTDSSARPQSPLKNGL